MNIRKNLILEVKGITNVKAITPLLLTGYAEQRTQVFAINDKTLISNKLYTSAKHCLVLAKVDTFMNNKRCVKQCERVQQSTARSSN